MKSHACSMRLEAIRRNQTTGLVVTGSFLLAATATVSGQGASRVCPELSSEPGREAQGTHSRAMEATLDLQLRDDRGGGSPHEAMGRDAQLGTWSRWVKGCL